MIALQSFLKIMTCMAMIWQYSDIFSRINSQIQKRLLKLEQKTIYTENGKSKVTVPIQRHTSTVGKRIYSLCSQEMIQVEFYKTQ